MNSKNCFCGSGLSFDDCCNQYISGKSQAQTAEKLMRSRYSAYASGAIDYLINTTAASERKFISKKDIQQWSAENHWLKLEIINSTENTVEFKAYYMDSRLQSQMHHEKSTFVKENGEWKYLNGIFNDEIE